MYSIVVLVLLKVFNYGMFIHKSANVQAYVGGFFIQNGITHVVLKMILSAICRKEKVCQWN